MITEQQLVAVIILCLFMGFLIGIGAWYLYGIPRCTHQFEKIIDYKSPSGGGYTVAHMCVKCGKTKITKV